MSPWTGPALPHADLFGRQQDKGQGDQPELGVAEKAEAEVAVLVEQGPKAEVHRQDG